MNLKRSTVLFVSAAIGVGLWVTMALGSIKATSPTTTLATAKASTSIDWVKEGPCIAPQLVAGPFDIHRRYRSMEGPYVSAQFRIEDIMQTPVSTLPEERVQFVEKGTSPKPAATSGTKGGGMMAISGEITRPVGLKDTKAEQRKLYWLKGFKLEVLDENGNVMPSAEFICHLNLDVDEKMRNEIFPNGERNAVSRLLTITQGQTEMRFPEGFAYPVAGDEVWKVAFQAANRTTNEHRRIRHRATFYFVKDADLVNPITALYLRVPSLAVVVDRPYAEAANYEKKSHPSCEMVSRGVNAPNSSTGGVHTDKKGRVLSGHWVVPPGKHEYFGVINDQDPAFSRKDRTLRYGWVHIHPCCEETVIRKCNGGSKEVLCSAKAETEMKGDGLELKHIEFLQPAQGLVLHKAGTYEIGARYNNTTSGALDSMVTVGMFFDDVDFARPDWAMPGYRAPYCGADMCKKPDVAAGAPPMFDPARDGPLLTKPVQMTLRTNDGNLNLVLDPSYAPKSATQIYKLLSAGVYDRTPFFRYEPGFVLQVALAAQKIKGGRLTAQQSAMIRRLPLEAKHQSPSGVHHKRFALSLGRNDNDEDSSETSFSILLGDAEHLDNKYTVFGYLADDAETNTTVEKMEQTFDAANPIILGCSKK